MKNIHFTTSYEGSLSEKILSVEVELAKYLTNLNYTRSPVRYISNPIGKCILQIQILLHYKIVVIFGSITNLGLNYYSYDSPWSF